MLHPQGISARSAVLLADTITTGKNSTVICDVLSWPRWEWHSVENPKWFHIIPWSLCTPHYETIGPEIVDTHSWRPGSSSRGHHEGLYFLNFKKKKKKVFYFIWPPRWQHRGLWNFPPPTDTLIVQIISLWRKPESQLSDSYSGDKEKIPTLKRVGKAETHACMHCPPAQCHTSSFSQRTPQIACQLLRLLLEGWALRTPSSES